MRILRWTAALCTGTVLAALPVLGGLAVLLAARAEIDGLRTGTATAADAIVALCAVLAALTLGWLGLTVLAATADELRSHRRGPRARPAPRTPGVPVLVRRTVALVVGVLLGSAAVSATAAERGAAAPVPQIGWATSAPLSVGVLDDPGWADQPTATEEPPRGAAGTRVLGEELVVLRGDTLWSLAEQRLGPQASPGDVLAEQQRLHAANAAVIGDDPDLLLPGQVLRLS